MNKKIIVLIVVGVIFLVVGCSISYYQSSLKAVGTDTDKVFFEVKQGEAAKTVIDNLADAKLIKNKYTAYIYLKMNKNISFQAGIYSFNRTMNVESLFNKMNSGEVNREVIQITFLEGKKVTRYVSQITEGFDFTEQEIYDTISNVTYLKELINKYWFLTDDILDEEIYYPLEGYLYPDTYQFEKNSSIKQIIEKLLDNTLTKLEPYKEQMESNEEFSIHEIMSMASIIEMEGKDSESRHTISQVIRSRLKDNWALGMDVTTYYAAKKEMTEVLYQAELDMKSPYNTRNNDGSMNGKLPIGPICNVSVESIDSALNPTDTSYYYFVANVCTGEVFFQKDTMEFVKKCNELRNICELN